MLITKTINNKAEALVFFNGWSLDHLPFLPITCRNYDLIIISDYSDIVEQAGKVLSFFNEYEKLYVIAWSFGVWAAAYASDFIKHPQAQYWAVNGTLFPVEQNYGINPKVFNLTVNNYSQETQERFYERMFSSETFTNETDYQKFLLNHPKRSLESQRAELLFFNTLLKKINQPRNVFSKALICHKDRIIPYKNQLTFWQTTKASYQVIEQEHFPFYSYNNWEEIISIFLLRNQVNNHRNIYNG